HTERWHAIFERGQMRDRDRRYLKKSGEPLDTLVSSIVERDAEGRFVRVIAVITDVTAGRHAEEAVKRERQLTELLVASSTEGIIGIDCDFRYNIWNPFMEAVSGLSREYVLGRSLFELFPHLRGTAIEDGWRGALEGRRSSLSDWAYHYSQTGRKGS